MKRRIVQVPFLLFLYVLWEGFLCVERWRYILWVGDWCLEGVLGWLILVVIVVFLEIVVGSCLETFLLFFMRLKGNVFALIRGAL